MPSQRKCGNCSAFLPNVESDPHINCAKCRGGKCSFEGQKCVDRKEWSKAVWDSLVPMQRPYASRNPDSRTKRPGKPSIASVKASQSNPSASSAVISSKNPTSVGPREARPSSISPGRKGSFSGFATKSSVSSQKLLSLSTPLRVDNIDALPPNKRKVVLGLLDEIHPDRRPFVKIIYDRIKEVFRIVANSANVSDMS